MNLLKLLAELDAVDDAVHDDYAETLAANIVNEVSPYMARNGHADLVRDWTPAAQVIEVKRYLAACIAATKAIDPPTTVEPEYLTIKQAAESLQLSERSIARMIENGLPVTRAGKAVRIKPADLEQHLSEQETVFD